ncbi:hypothetical protein PENSPDRAFT_748112 [Peniophora sp. CONT]|nr:hypothetical protein PENSPDRAFT_748112 [Peniophora sp. CONT]
MESELDTLHASTSTTTADLASEISRKLLNMDPLTAEREVIQLQIKETRNHISTLEARDALLREHHTASISNEDDPPQPHVRAALGHFFLELRADVDRMKGEVDVVKELTERLQEEREAVKGTFERQIMAFLESTKRWIDTLTEVVQTVQSLDEDERVAIRNTLAETKGEDVVKQFWEFCEANPRKAEDSIQA